MCNVVICIIDRFWMFDGTAGYSSCKIMITVYHSIIAYYRKPIQAVYKRYAGRRSPGTVEVRKSEKCIRIRIQNIIMKGNTSMCDHQTIKQQKKQIRAEVKKAVSALDPDYCEAADRKIMENIISLSEYREAESIFCFVSMDTEVNTHPLIKQMLEDGKKVGVPRCLELGRMEAFRIQSMEDDLEPGTWGILEPEESCPKMDPASFQLAVVPCCTCSHDGSRLGYGGGFYDRYLNRSQAVRAIICREKIMREDIPVEDHDLKMDIVISEQGIRRV